MEVELRARSASSWRWPLLLTVVFLNILLPSLVLSYGLLLVHSVTLGLPLWLGLTAPATFILTYGLSQCWCRDAADTWGGPSGHRVMAALGVLFVVAGLVTCAFLSGVWQAVVYGVFGGLGSSLISAQVDAVIFETYDSHLGIIRGLCFCGQAIGQTTFPHILSAIIDCYGYPIMYIVLGGIMLQTLPAIMFLKVDETVRRPLSFSRYSDLSKAYAVFNNGDANVYTAELQLHNLGKKCWKSPADDNLHREDEFDNEGYDNNDSNATVTPPPSPEEKRRNIFGVEILPEIPEVSEESGDEEEDKNKNKTSINKKRLSVAIKRLSTMGDNLSDYITKQVRRDSQTSQIDNFTEVEVTYDNIAPITEIQREKVFNSFSFRCRSTYASLRRRILMPSYRVYRIRRRLTFLLYNLNDTFVKPLTRSLSCWRFYPSVLLCFSKLILTAVYLASLPTIASQMQPTTYISMTETNFLMMLHGFAWVCFLLATPWLAQTPKRNFQYITVAGLAISTAACFLIAEAKSHDMFSIGCVVGGLGYGALTSCWETVAQDFVGSRKWPKIHSTLETISVSLLAVFAIGASLFVKQNGDLQFTVFLLGVVLSIITVVWFLIALVSIYVTKMKSFSYRTRRWV